MRYVPVSRIEEGMILARPVYGSNYEVLLSQGTTLTGVHLQRIARIGYAGIYIDDDFSSGIQVEDLLPAGLRFSLIRAAKEAWQVAERVASGKGRATPMQMTKVIMPVIESLIANKTRMVELIDLKPEEDYLYYHAANSVVLALLTGLEIGLSGVQLYELGLSTLLHDIGNIFIPKIILEKPGKLSPDEYNIIKSHTEKGFEYLKGNFDISIEGCMGALQHHENFDGSGYPSGLAGEKISIYGRIIAITDVYDAMTSRRPFREMLYPQQAMEYLEEKSGSLFDPLIVKAFQKAVPLFPTGVCVELNTGVRAIVCQNHPGHPDRPKVQLLNSNTTRHMHIDLLGDAMFQHCKILRIIEI